MAKESVMLWVKLVWVNNADFYEYEYELIAKESVKLWVKPVWVNNADCYEYELMTIRNVFSCELWVIVLNV